MEFKVIRTREQYQAYLDEVHSLIMLNPAIGSPESDRLELLSVLIDVILKRECISVRFTDKLESAFFVLYVNE